MDSPSPESPGLSGTTVDHTATVTVPSGGRSCLRRDLTAAQAEAEPDPARARHDEIDAEEQAEDINAVDRPARQDQEAEQQGDDAGYSYPDPGRFALHAERQNNPHNAGSDQRCAEHEREQHRGEQRIFERHEACDDVEHAEQSPEQELAPALDLEGVDDLGDAGDDHHHADD